MDNSLRPDAAIEVSARWWLPTSLVSLVLIEHVVVLLLTPLTIAVTVWLSLTVARRERPVRAIL
jgi:hypothetical protein